MAFAAPYANDLSSSWDPFPGALLSCDAPGLASSRRGGGGVSHPPTGPARGEGIGGAVRQRRPGHRDVPYLGSEEPGGEGCAGLRGARQLRTMLGARQQHGQMAELLDVHHTIPFLPLAF